MFTTTIFFFLYSIKRTAIYFIIYPSSTNNCYFKIIDFHLMKRSRTGTTIVFLRGF
ncbi:hypothetical protein BD770DRAFT_404348, partial [Pilaira anomala]